MAKLDESIQLAISQVMANYAMGLDRHEWALLRSCFCDQILVDYGEKSAATGEPGKLRSADSWLEVLKEAITRFDMTHHMINSGSFF